MSISDKPILVGFKKIIEFSAYIKLERNGIKIENKFLQQSNLVNLKINHNQYKYIDQSIKEIDALEIRSKKGDMIFHCNIKDIIKINDKFIYEGKLTLIIQIKEDKIILFISKSTKELLDAFISKITGKTPETKDLSSKNKNVNKSNNNNILLKNKRRFHELYAAKHNKNTYNNPKMRIESNNYNNEKVINNLLFLKNKNEKNKFIFDFPDYLLFIIFEYLSKKILLSKVSLLNKELKKYSDSYIESLIIRDDTPKESFNRIINRFKNLKDLTFGKAKNFKNQNLKYFNCSLHNLERLDISQIENLNDHSIKTLFSRMKGIKVHSIKLNYFLESLNSALLYANQFFKNLNELTLYRKPFLQDEKYLNEKFIKFPKYYHINLFKTILNILNSREHKLKILNIFAFYMPNLNENDLIFKNLIELSFDLLMINHIKNLKIFSNCENLISFKIGDIIIKDNIVKNEPVFHYINLNEINQQLINNLNEQNINNLNQEIDFDNDYIDIFSKIFYKMKNLKKIEFGSFLTDDLCKLISIHLLNLEKVNFSSNYITDEGIKLILISCKNIKELNLMNCLKFLGSCFFDIHSQDFPINLKKAQFSISTYNYYHVINFLRSKGIKAENYIKIKSN
jgi:hypothetical protein